MLLWPIRPSPRRSTLGEAMPLKALSSTIAKTLMAQKRQPQGEDPALAWARSHPQHAQNCLTIPPPQQQQLRFDWTNTVNQELIPKMLFTRGWSEYWKARSWSFLPPSSPIHEQTTAPQLTSTLSSVSTQQGTLAHAQALASHIMSAPMTVVQFWAEYESWRRQEQQRQIPFMKQPAHPPVDCNISWSCCCVGARAEGTLPVEYWKEALNLMMITTSATANIKLSGRQHEYPRSCRPSSTGDFDSVGSTTGISKVCFHWKLDFLGPDLVMPPAEKSTINLFWSDPYFPFQGTLTLRWLYRGRFHEYIREQQQNNKEGAGGHSPIETWDAFILFNPGLGHNHLKKDWEPTLRLLWGEPSDVSESSCTMRRKGVGRPVLVTAHSRLDAWRDEQILLGVDNGSLEPLKPEEKAGSEGLSSGKGAQAQLLDHTISASRNEKEDHERHLRLRLYRLNPFASRITYIDPFDDRHRVRPNHYVATCFPSP